MRETTGRQNESPMRTRMNPDLIYDVGMYDGRDTAYYLFKGYRVVAIEADPKLVDDANHQFATEIADGRLVVVNAVVGPKEGVAQFWVSEDKKEWSSVYRSMAMKQDKKTHAIEVHCVPFRKILEEYGVPYYLKIDIEGSDRYCLRDIDKTDAPAYLSCEISTISDIVAVHNLGYNRFKCIIQNNFTQLLYRPLTIGQRLIRRFEKHPALLSQWRQLNRLVERFSSAGSLEDKRFKRTDDGWTFQVGSSGPFGEETHGQWQSFEETVHAWLSVQLGYTIAGQLGRGAWHDLHAKKEDTSHGHDAK